MNQISRWVPAYSAGGFTRPALALDANGNIILIGEAVDFIALYGLKALYLGLPASTPFPPVAPDSGTVVTPPPQTPTPPTDATPTPPDPTPPIVVTPDPPPTTPPPPSATGGSGNTAPAFTLGGITRPQLYFDGAGNIILDPVAAQFVATYGLKALYLGLPPSTPFPPVAATPPSTPTDSNAAANSVAEGASANSATGVTASSISPTGQAITYALTSDSSGGGFKIDATTGVVTVADPGKIDFETAANNAYQISVRASDGIFTVSQTFTISVTNVAPSTPIDANAATNTVAEGAAVGTIVGITTVSNDVNGPAVTYSLSADTSNGGFAVNATTGVVTVADASKLDYESSGAGKAYSITVTASDGSQTASQNFSIAVSDVPLTAPTDANTSANLVAEGAAVGSTVGLTAFATDPNGPTTTYSLTADSSGGGFTINAVTGVVTVGDPSKIDFESAPGNAYSVTVQASNGAMTTSQSFSIGVGNIAPLTPVDANAASNLIAEGAANGSTVGVTASSTDVNGPAVTYSLTGDSSGGGFAIDAATGVVTVADASRIDFESSGGSYTVTAQASDGTLTSSQTFTIAVSDIAPSTPVDANAAANLIAEGAANGSTVGITVSATDINGPAVVYSLIGDTSGGGFAIDSATGVVTIADATRIDFESSGGSYSITTQASDGTLSSSQTFTIGVTNVAPPNPVDANAATNTIAEGAANGSTVGITVSSIDVNGPATTYTLVGDTSGGGFAIDAATGVVTVADATRIDFESSGGSYTIVAQASDGTLTSSQAFTIAVSDIAPSTPVDANAAANLIAEGAANGSTVGITASSTDINGPSVVYSLIGDTSGGGFAIDSATGVVTIADATRIDFESSGGSYSITTQASDGTLSSSQTFTITVTNVAPPNPVDANAATNTIAEGEANGSTVGITVSSIDVNGPATTYTLVGDTSGGGFTIDTTTGVVTVADASRIDFESSGGSYTIVTQASDGTLASSQAFTIAVTNAPPSVPTDADAAANKTFAGAAAGSAAGVTAAAIDPSGGTVTYALLDDGGAVANGGDRFQIDASTGVVRISGVTPITYDSVTPANNDYTVTVRASDPSGAFTSQTFTITVDPNQPPLIVTNGGGGGNAGISVVENGTAVTTVNAIDGDNGPSPISYSIVGGDDANKFSIVASGPGAGTLTFVTPPDFETPTDTATNGNNTYTVIVRASDGAAFDDQTITVTVTDANDAPVITSNGGGGTASISINENQTAVTTVTASDQDFPAQTLSYSLAGGADQGKFTINATTGALAFIGAPNFEAPGSAANSNAYTVQVQVSDNGNPVLNDIQTITVNVQNINEAPTTNAVTTSGAEDAASIAITLTGTDPDAGDSIATYTITNLPSPAQGVLYSDAGLTNAVVSGQTYGATLYLDPAPNFNGTVTFSATANDTFGLAGTTATETINVTPVNDAPVNNGVPASIQAMSGFAQAITGLSISDVDAGSATNLTTTLASAGGTITVGTVANITISGSGTGSVQLLGSQTAINNALAGNNVQFTAADGATNPTTTSISVTTSDAGNTGSGGTLTDTDTIAVGVVPQVWFINSDQSAINGSAPRGSQTNPFSTISEFNASSGPGTNDYIYLKAGTYSGDGINLKDGQTLLGDDQALSFPNPLGGAPIDVESASSARPTINVTTNGDQGIDLASGNTVRGVNITTGAGTTGLDDGSGATGGSVGALTVSNVAISGAGGAVDIDQGGVLNVTLESASSSGGAYGIQLGGSISGTFTGGSGTLSGHTTSEFDINGGAGAVSYSGTIGDGTGLSASIAGRTGGSVTLSGNINDGNDAGGGISAASNTGGTITFSGATKTLNTGSSTAVNLGTNTSATINFTNGGLDIDTTSAAGFNATGGGTVNVTGTGNSIASTTGTALNVTSTTIGASDLTFQSISSGGGANNGIVLDTTGSLGGLHVTGSGTTVGSGGTIQSKTGADGSTTSGIGIYLNNTTDVQLNGMNLQNFENLGLYGTGVNGLQFTNSTVGGTIGTSTGSNDAAIGFGTTGDGGANGLTGSSLIDNVNVSGAIEHNVEIYQHSGQTNLTIRNSNIHDNNTSTGSDGLLVETFGTADLRLKVSGTTFDDNRSQAFQLNALRQSTVNLTVDDNIVLRSNQGNEGFIFQNSNDANLTLAITNNTMTGIVGTNIFVGQVAGQGTALSKLDATISGNTINQTGGVNRTVVAFLSSVSGSTAQSQTKLLIDNNTITSDIGSQQIFVSTPDANTAPNYHATVTNNTVIATNASAANSAITVQATQGVAGQGATATTEIRGNDVQRPNGVGAGISDIVLRTAAPGGGASDPSIRLDPGISGSSDVATVLSQNNPLSTTLALISPAGSITVVNNVVQLPQSPISPPLPLLAAQGGVAADTPTSGETDLSQAQLDIVVAAALGHWQSAGLTALQLATLQSIVYNVSDLSGTRLGDRAAGHIFIDNDAAGYGWFVDPTPGDSSEFATQVGGSATHLAATSSQVPAGHYDLLTAVMHEMGHAIGLDDRTSASDSSDLMYGYLQTGERRLPDSIDVVLASEAALPSSAQAAAGTPIVVGTAGNDSIDAGSVDAAHGGAILFGSAGADTFVFGPGVQPGAKAQLTHVADYSAAQGDRFDFAGLMAVQSPVLADDLAIRAVGDPSGLFATLQINTASSISEFKAGGNWIAVAQLDGLHVGDAVDVVIGPATASQLLHIQVDLIA